MPALSTLIHRVQKGISAIELVYTSHPHWPLPPPTHVQKRSSVPIPVPGSSDEEGESNKYDAKLLLLSVRNADKTLAPGDATYAQRLGMMILLAQDIAHHQQEGDNIAVAIIDEPTFVGKSKVLLKFLGERLVSVLSPPSTGAPVPADFSPPTTKSTPHLQLVFVVGMDTLERLFAPRYYASPEDMRLSLRRLLSPEGDDAWVVCARRLMHASLLTDAQLERERSFMETIEEFVQSRRVTLINIGEEERTISSTHIRESRHRGDLAWRSCVTSSIADYVEQHSLYRS
ncbi:predicted protein [Sparassis crispa]|uniref:Uncharacterized protein n=1 Tax=Sparassis crispa TaxID=139825 RepID=A0A401H0D3_9APHY|nr:predicted protein [Sparassis crispa]GBE87868.1 predicted protein [Sparassis crispa]